MGSYWTAGLLANRRLRFVSAVLILQAIGFYALSRGEDIPLNGPLSEFPTEVRDWKMVQDAPLDPEVMRVLRADDVLNRLYVNKEGRVANLFVGFFKSQRTGQAPHSPKNCLPGAGWAPTRSDVLAIQVPGRAEPIRVNRYVVSKGDQKSVVLYWYQTRDRVIASEYTAKVYLVADAIRYNRTDTSLVRVVVPMDSSGESEAIQTATSLVQSMFTTLRQYLP